MILSVFYQECEMADLGIDQNHEDTKISCITFEMAVKAVEKFL